MRDKYSFMPTITKPVHGVNFNLHLWCGSDLYVIWGKVYSVITYINVKMKIEYYYYNRILILEY